MEQVTKMLRAVINGQSAMKVELLGEIKKNREEIAKNREEIAKNRKGIETVEKNLTKRIDKVGLQIAQLEDDAPTIEEFDELEKRVTKIEKDFSSA